MSWQIKAAIAVATGLAVGSPALAQESAWGFEVTPYLWAGGVEGDVTVRGRTVDVDRDFDDLTDRLDFMGSLLSVGYKDHFAVWMQIDYVGTDTDEMDAEDLPAGGDIGKLESDFFAGTLGFGYRFGEPNGRRNLDLLLGARYMDVENTLTLNGIGEFDRSESYLDPVVIARPSFRISERWRFNPTFSIGGGNDADLTWELQPQVQFQINDNLGLRFGYRNLYYDIESDNGLNKFDGSYRGLVLGLGGTFGNQKYYMSKKQEPAPAPPMASTAPPPPPPMAAPEPPGDRDGDGINDNIDKCPSTASAVVVDALGCGFNTTLAVQFETNSAVLKPESNAELDRLVEVMKATPTVAGYVEGYTDSTGSAAYNKQLSKQRAEAVADYLITQGVSRDRVIPRGFGQSNPVASNGTEEGRAQNRRVVLRRVDSDAVRVSSDQ